MKDGRLVAENPGRADVAPTAAFLATPAGVTLAVVVCSLIWGTT